LIYEFFLFFFYLFELQERKTIKNIIIMGKKVNQKDWVAFVKKGLGTLLGYLYLRN